MSDYPIIDYIESRARACDPETSQVGAQAIRNRLGILHQQFLDKLQELGQATAHEVAVAISHNHGRINTLRRRASDLVQAGKIRKVGKRLCNETNNLATFYECVPDQMEK